MQSASLQMASWTLWAPCRERGTDDEPLLEEREETSLEVEDDEKEREVFLSPPRGLFSLDRQSMYCLTQHGNHRQRGLP